MGRPIGLIGNAVTSEDAASIQSQGGSCAMQKGSEDMIRSHAHLPMNEPCDQVRITIPLAAARRLSSCLQTSPYS